MTGFPPPQMAVLRPNEPAQGTAKLADVHVQIEHRHIPGEEGGPPPGGRSPVRWWGVSMPGPRAVLTVGGSALAGDGNAYRSPTGQPRAAPRLMRASVRDTPRRDYLRVGSA
jgi:hypothetical protein